MSNGPSVEFTSSDHETRFLTLALNKQDQAVFHLALSRLRDQDRGVIQSPHYSPVVKARAMTRLRVLDTFIARLDEETAS